MNLWIQKNRKVMKRPHTMITLKRFPKDLALIILFTLLCIPFVLIPPLNEISPVRVTAAPSVMSNE